MEKVVYLYHHLPKCGGVSFIRTCEKWFPPRRERLGSYPDAERIAEFARTRLDFDELPPNCFIHGHLVRPGIRPFERYGDYIAAGKMRLVTIVREPLERQISAYYYRQKGGRPWPEPLEKWLSTGRNQLSKYLQITAENLRERLDAYFVVGTTESLQLTADILAAKTGNPRLEVPHLNTAPRAEEAVVDEAVRQKFAQANALDYAIHRYAVERLQREAAGLDLG